MAFWDDLFKRVKETADETERTLKKEAGRAAARKTFDQIKKRAEAVAEDFVSSAERELEASQAARGDEPTYTPPGTEMDDDVSDLISRANDLEREHRESRLRAIRLAAEPDEGQIPQTAPPPRRKTLAEQRAEREARARSELEAIKARLNQGGDAPAPEPGDDPPKRTL